MENLDKRTAQLSDSLTGQAACPEKYAIKGLIGQGGMGMVFHAFDGELNREVAIKVLFYEGSREKESQERFLREAQILSVLQHENIVRIYNSGLNKFGNPYHVMEYLKGVALFKELESGPLAPDAFYELFRQVLSGLESAHKEKIVHRDLKPSNIMHCTDEEGRSVYKLIDFGIAKIESPGSGKTLTRTNSVMGSPYYISPEQCRGERGDYLSDIYSIGCVMYECISGHPPFQGDSSFETMFKHMKEPPPKLVSMTQSKKSLRLSALLERCLEKDPAARPESVSELIAELDEIFADKTEQLDLFVKRSPALSKEFSWARLLAIGAISLLVIGIASWAAASALKPNSSLEVVSTEAKQSRLLSKNAATVERIENGLTANCSLGVKKRYLESLFALGRAQLNSKETYADAEKTYNKALDFCIANGGMGCRQAASTALRGKAKWMRGDFAGANADFDEAIKLSQDLEQSKALQIDITFERSLMNVQQRNFTAARANFNKADMLFEDLRSGMHKLQELDTIYQELDKGGLNRSDLAYSMAKQLDYLKPKTPEEALSMLLLSNTVAERLSRCPLRMHGEVQHILQNSLRFLPMVTGNEALKNETRNMASAYEKKQVKCFTFTIRDGEKSNSPRSACVANK